MISKLSAGLEDFISFQPTSSHPMRGAKISQPTLCGQLIQWETRKTTMSSTGTWTALCDDHQCCGFSFLCFKVKCRKRGIYVDYIKNGIWRTNFGLIKSLYFRLSFTRHSVYVKIFCYSADNNFQFVWSLFCLSNGKGGVRVRFA